MGATSGEFIEVVGARQNNLKGINLKLPLGELIVFTGPRYIQPETSASGRP
jgi:excinuclease UvrABC ATPase subunit